MAEVARASASSDLFYTPKAVPDHLADLIAACKAGSLETVRTLWRPSLLESISKLTREDTCVPLLNAAHYLRTDVVQFLLDEGCNVRQRGTVHPYTGDGMTVAELQGINAPELINKMLFMHPRKSKRRDAILAVKESLQLADVQQQAKAQELEAEMAARAAQIMASRPASPPRMMSDAHALPVSPLLSTVREPSSEAPATPMLSRSGPTSSSSVSDSGRRHAAATEAATPSADMHALGSPEAPAAPMSAYIVKSRSVMPMSPLEPTGSASTGASASSMDAAVDVVSRQPPASPAARMGAMPLAAALTHATSESFPVPGSKRMRRLGPAPADPLSSNALPPASAPSLSPTPSSSSLAPAASVGSLPAGISGPPASPRPIAASTSVATPQPAAKKPRLVPKPSPPVLARSTSAVTSVASGAVAAGVLEETDMSQPPQPAVLKSKSSHEPGACAQPPVPSHSAPLIAAAAPHVTAHAAPPSSLPAHADRPRYSTDAAAQVLLGVPDLVLHDCVVDFAPCQQRISPDTLPPLADWMCARQCSTPLSQGIADDVTTAVAHAISKALASPPVTAALSGSSLASSADNSGCSSSSMAAIMVGAPTPHTALLRAMSGMLDGSTGNGTARNVSVRTYDSLPHFMEASAAEMMSTVRTASNEAAAAAGSSPAAAGSCSAASACVLPPMPPSLAMLSRFSTDFVSAPQVAAMVDSVVRRLRSGNVLGISGHLCYDDIVAPSVTASTPTPPAPASVLVFSVPMHLGVPPVDAFLAAAGRVHAQMQVAVGGGKPRPRLQELFNADHDCRALRKALMPYAISLKTACSGARFAPCSSVAVLVASRPRMNAALMALHEPAVLSLARDLWSAALAAALRSLGEPPSARGSVVSITGAKYSLNAISVETVAHSPSTQILLRSAAPPVMEWCGREYVIASIVLSPAAK